MDKYYKVVDFTGVDCFDELAFSTKEKALYFAECDWNTMTNYDKKRRESYYVLETDDPDSLDGNIIKIYK